MPPIIRLATEQDANQIQAIYAPVVRDTTISFELAIPTVEEMQQRIASTLKTHPWLVCDNAGEVLGYVYAGKHRTRAAYQWATDVSVYVNEHTRRSGIGRALYTALFRLLKLQGFSQAYAGITLPNPPSIGLHKSLGFQPVGVYRSVGFKFGMWRDVGWWSLALQADNWHPSGPPTDLRYMTQDTTEWHEALKSGLSLLNMP